MNDDDREKTAVIDLANWTGDEIDRIQAKKPSERTDEEWFFLVEYSPSEMEKKEFPFDRMTPEFWKDLILRDPIYLQYGPPVDELRKILTKEDFEDWNSYDICQAIMFEGEWLAEEGFLPMENITQEDFDEYFGADLYGTAEEFWNMAPAYFPDGFPPHIRLPYPPLKSEEKE